jgi:uncharacterized membrane protein YheB (UPF0754 family)
MNSMSWSLILIPLASAFSCWLVIRLFFLLLFHPRKSISWLGLRIQGVLPHQQSKIASGIGKYVAQNFFSGQLIEEKITDPKNLQKIMPVVEEHIDDFLRNKLKKQMPIVGMFIGDKTITSLKSVFLKELENLFPVIMKNFASNLQSELDIEKLVSDKINAISLEEAEGIFKTTLSAEIRLLSILSATTGLLIGALTALILAFAG